MAANLGFRQQCPSCDEKVLIKDANLIGKKIECTKCKYRFLVEKPKEEVDDKSAKKSKGSAAPEAKTAPAKGKTKRPDDADADFRSQAGKKKTKLILGLALAGVAVLLLGVAGFFIFTSGDTGPIKRNKGSGNAAVKPTTPSQTNNTTDPQPAPKSTTPALADASHHLPANLDAVFNLSVQDFLRSPFGVLAQDSGLQPTMVRNTLGVTLNEIDRVFLGVHAAQQWRFLIVRAGAPFDLDLLKKSLKLKPLGPIKGQEYFLVEAPLQQLAPLALKSDDKPLACRLPDPFTLVLADLEPMKQFLDVQGKPPLQPSTAPGGNARQPYQTLDNSRLKAMLERVEARKPLVLSAAFNLETRWNNTRLAELEAGLALLKSPLSTLGVSLHTDEGIGAVTGIDCRNSEHARQVETLLRQFLGQRLDDFTAATRLHVKWAGQNNPDPLPAKPAAAATPSPRDMSLGLLTLEGPKQLDKTVLLNGLLDLDGFNVMRLAFLDPLIHRQKGIVALEMTQPSPHDLALAAKAYGDQYKKFPRGAFERPVPDSRRGRPWTPDQRVGWLPELLPYLGYGDLQRLIEVQKSWRDPGNLKAAMTLVPYFMDPSYPESARYLRYPGLRPAVAATHFVGIAGVGLDAAEYADNDPDTAPQRGVFGYDRATPLSDVGDHTILMIQVPPTQLGPWLAGGGATVRGVPVKNSIQPFVATSFHGKKGTYAVMSDGSVRFLAADIADDVFKALCTIKKDKPIKIDGVPVVPPPERKSELKTSR